MDNTWKPVIRYLGDLREGLSIERQLGYDYFEAFLAREEGYSWVNDDYSEANRKIEELIEMGAFPDGH